MAYEERITQGPAIVILKLAIYHDLTIRADYGPNKAKGAHYFDHRINNLWMRNA